MGLAAARFVVRGRKVGLSGRKVLQLDIKGILVRLRQCDQDEVLGERVEHPAGVDEDLARTGLHGLSGFYKSSEVDMCKNK